MKGSRDMKAIAEKGIVRRKRGRPAAKGTIIISNRPRAGETRKALIAIETHFPLKKNESHSARA
jgi:hypothetical protein